MLAATLLADRNPIVVAGTHGKTDHVDHRQPGCCARAGVILRWLIGGVPQNLGTGAHLGGGDEIVLEGDEYDTAFFDKESKFLHYRPRRAILTGVELRSRGHLR